MLFSLPKLQCNVRRVQEREDLSRKYLLSRNLRKSNEETHSVSKHLPCTKTNEMYFLP